MNGKDIFRGLQYIGDDLIENAECGQFPLQNSESGRKKRHIRRPLLAAALAALLILLVGCAVVYVLKMESVKIGNGTGQRDYSLVDGVYVEDPHTVDTTVLTLAGLEGTDAYKACAEFYTFQTEYTANGEKLSQASTLPEDYWDSYGEVMSQKAAELAEKYGLKPEGALLNFRTTRNLCDALGVERFVRDSQDISADVDGGGCYDTGNFWLNMRFRFPENRGYEVTDTSGVLYWNRRDSFSRDFVTLEDSGDWVERNYTTPSGSTVLILTSASQERGYIFCDRGDALMTLWLNVNPELLSEAGGVVSAESLHMTDRQLELVADSIDFAIQPKIPTQADVDAQAEVSQESTQNGYTLRLKSVETDGYVARILVGVTAPEDMDIESLNISTGEKSFSTTGRQSSGGGGAFNDVPDGDGLANTKDLLLMCSMSFHDDLRPFELGATWDLDIVDLWADKRDASARVLAEGEWHFSITFDDTNTDYRETELLSKPTMLKASTGWRQDGTDVIEELPVISFKLRKFSSEILRDTSAEPEELRNTAYADFYGWSGHFAYAVMQDGTKVQLSHWQNFDTIDLAQLDYVLLPDGTTLPIPENSGT